MKLKSAFSFSGSADFYGMNHYTTQQVSDSVRKSDSHKASKPSWQNDVAAVTSQDPAWPPTASVWFRVAPHGIRNALNRIKTEYDSPVIFVTENGFSDKGDIEDSGRISYFNVGLNFD